MYQSVILSSAAEDIRKAALWYNKEQAGLGKKFTACVRQKIYFIRQHPEAFAIRYDDVRMAVLPVFPFMVHYTINKKKKLILISAVLHTSRDPNIWKE